MAIEIEKIKKITEEFFGKMTTAVSSIEASISAEKEGVVDMDIELEEPQILIGQGGQTLLEIQRLLRMVLSKNLQELFFLNLDINGYKKKKVEYLKHLSQRF